MTILFIDSFDHYTTLGQKGWIAGSNAVITTSGRNSTVGRMANSGNNTGSYLDLPSTYTTLVVGAAFNIDENTVQRDFLGLADSGTIQLGLRLDGSGRIEVRRNATLIQTGTTILALDTWYYIEFKATIDNSSGSYEVRINGVSELSNIAQDTQATGNAYINRVYFQSTAAGGGATTGRVYADDVYILDTTGSPNDFLGDVRVQTILPSGNGNSSQLVGSDGNSTDNYLLVDEAAPDGDTTSVQSLTSGHKDTYAYGNLTPTTGTVYAVQLLPYAKKTDAGLRQIKSVARVATDEADGATETLTTDYLYYPEIMATQPNGGAWTITDVNSAEFGVEIV